MLRYELLQNLKNNGIQAAAAHADFPAATLPSEDGIASLFTPSVNPHLVCFLTYLWVLFVLYIILIVIVCFFNLLRF